eukprot:10740184-Ditylum_brightwellii.AAC.1
MIEDLLDKAAALTSDWHTRIPRSPMLPISYPTTASLSQSTTPTTQYGKARGSTIAQNKHLRVYLYNDNKRLMVSILITLNNQIHSMCPPYTL